MDDIKSKQVIVMRKDLQMTKGKMIAQGSHACVGLLLQMMDVKENTNDNDGTPSGEYSLTLNVKEGGPLDGWIRNGFKKVCVYVNSEEELLKIYDEAKDEGLPVIMIEDGGLTMFKGVPTKTCVAIGPEAEEKIDKITGGLKLL